MKDLILRTFFGTLFISLSAPDSEGKVSGGITSQIPRENPDEPDDALDAIESLILAHACAGVDVESPAYIEGLETALDAIDNNS